LGVDDDAPGRCVVCFLFFPFFLPSELPSYRYIGSGFVVGIYLFDPIQKFVFVNAFIQSVDNEENEE